MYLIGRTLRTVEIHIPLVHVRLRGELDLDAVYGFLLEVPILLQAGISKLTVASTRIGYTFVMRFVAVDMNVVEMWGDSGMEV